MARTPTQPTLPLRPVGDDWRLDEHTRTVGRRGLAQARAALAAATERAAGACAGERASLGAATERAARGAATERAAGSASHRGPANLTGARSRRAA